MFSMLYVTTSSKDEAERIAKGLLEQRLVACANIFPIGSFYWWKGEIVEDKEFSIIFKTRTALLERAIATIKNTHSYEIPCIVSYEMGKGEESYLNWIKTETKDA